MTKRDVFRSRKRLRQAAGAALVAFALALGGLGIGAAHAQQQNQPGFLDAIGRFFQDSAANLNAGLKGTQDNLNNLGSQATGAARDTVDSVARLPGTRVVTGRERCLLSANGAPDCVAAAEAVCKAKGLPTGRSLDIQSAEDCPVHVLLGRAARPGECKQNTYVTRAVCQ